MSATESATQVLRAMLDERGVVWWPSEVPWDEDSVTYWIVGQTRWVAIENGEGALVLSSSIMTDLTPAQAIAATLGAGTCHNANVVMHTGEIGFQCSECGSWDDTPDPVYCHDCGREVVGE